jgi:hypothetical protein
MNTDTEFNPGVYMLSPDTGELHYLQFEAENSVLRFNAGHLRHAENTHVRYIAEHRSSYEPEYYILKFKL